MRAVQVVATEGPSAVEVNGVEPPTPSEDEVLVDVHAVGVSFPDLLLSKGQYQLKPELPFTLGVDLAGEVAAAPAGSGLRVGERVAGCLPYGAAAEQVAVPADMVFPLPDALSFAKAAALPMNYLTAHFALAVRAQLRSGETVLVHGASGGVGTACLQVAKGYGARTIAVTSTEHKGEIARAAGADDVVLVEDFLASVRRLTEGRGADVVVDVVGGEVFTDSVRSLAVEGRLLVLGFAAGAIPTVKVNRLLLNNVDVRGVGWGAYAMTRPGYCRWQWEQLVPMLSSGVVDPPVAASYGLEEMATALADMDQRRALGKLVLTLR